LSAFECLDQKSLHITLKHFQKPCPTGSFGAVSVVMEVEDTELKDAELALEAIFEQGLVLDGVLAKNTEEQRSLWQIREGVAESILHDHVVHQEDVSVAVASLQEFYATIEARYRHQFPDAEVFFFGHIGDGNLHIFIQKPKHQAPDDFFQFAKASDLMLFETLKEFQGSVSAEHGVGLLKKHALPFSRSPHELKLMKEIKSVFDPKHRLNPGKIFGHL
jgi:FAD/FMN-containing dehydrogenase